jgi:hypothetical protein
VLKKQIDLLRDLAQRSITFDDDEVVAVPEGFDLEAVRAALAIDPIADARAVLKTGGFEYLGDGLWAREDLNEAIAIADGAVWVQSPGSLSPDEMQALAVHADNDEDVF